MVSTLLGGLLHRCVCDVVLSWHVVEAKKREKGHEWLQKVGASAAITLYEFVNGLFSVG